MNHTGTLIVRTFLSKAQLPIPGATAVVYTEADNGEQEILAIRTTDESGVAGPIRLQTNGSLGLSPGASSPYTNYQLIVEHPDYQLALFRDLQVFPGVETVQDVLLLPLSVPGGPEAGTSTITPQGL